jgi:DNA-directed RNA polymerase subunit alpha
LAGVSEESLTAVVVEEEVQGHLTSEIIETPIENLDLSVRVFNSLKRTGITTIGEVIDLLGKGDEAVMSIRNFGEKSLTELRLRMTEKGYLENEDEEEESEEIVE